MVQKGYTVVEDVYPHQSSYIIHQTHSMQCGMGSIAWYVESVNKKIYVMCYNNNNNNNKNNNNKGNHQTWVTTS